LFPLLLGQIYIGQESILSPILSALYISPISYIFEKRAKNIILCLSISFLSFVDDGLFISQEKTYEKIKHFNFL